MGEDKIGIDEMGVDEIALDEVGSRRSGVIPKSITEQAPEFISPMLTFVLRGNPD